MAGRILIADGVSTNRIILKVKLTAACYEVLQAVDRAQTLEIARAERPDLILLDHALPGGGAARTCEQLKADPATRAVPVVFLTAVGDRKERLEGLRAGADDVLTKPMDEAALLALVRSLIRSCATHEELTRRQSAAEDLGFADAQPKFTGQARVALIAANRETGFAWRIALARNCTSQIEVLTRAQALDPAAASEAPDVFVVAATLKQKGDGLSLLSELRSRSATRHAVILVHNPSGDAGLSAMALDLGANTVLTGAFDGTELAARLVRLLERKVETDGLRDLMDQRLRLAMKDPLTGVYNRRYAQSYLLRIAREAQAHGQPFALMLLDLDRFKTVNDRFGHSVGDEVLIETAARLQQNLREIDLLARIGGEEFLVAMPGTDATGAGLAAERLRAVIGDLPIRSAKGLEVSMTMSIGVVVSTRGKAHQDVDIDHLMERADHALYSSKAEGRNQVTFVRPAA